MANPLSDFLRVFSPGISTGNVLTGNGPPGNLVPTPPQNQYLDTVAGIEYIYNPTTNTWSEVPNPKGNYLATVPPGANDDVLAGYEIGSPWLIASGPALYMCTDSAQGAATWFQVTSGGGGGLPTIGSSTDNALVRWDGLLGTAVQNSNAVLTDAGLLTLALPLPVGSGGLGVANPTANALLIGNGASAVSSLAVGTNDQILFGNTGSAPSFGSLVAGSGISITGKTIAATGGTGDVVGPASAVDNRVARFDSITGKLIQSSLVGISDTGDVTGVAALTVGGALTLSGAPLAASEGGSGARTFTSNAALFGAGASAFQAGTALSNGQLYIGSSGNIPVAATLTAGTNISITNGVGTITIDSTASGGLTYVPVAGASQAMSINSAYQNNNAALTTFTLPVTAAAGSQIEVIGVGVGGFVIAQGAGQQIVFGDQQTTVGVGGSLASSQRYDNVIMRCIVDDTTWKIESVQGNLTFV